MPLNPNQFRFGPCNVYFFESAAFVNIGYIDNVDAEFTPMAAELFGGQAGTSPMTRVITGLGGRVTFDCQQIEIKNWQRAALGVGQSFQGVTTPANKRFEFQARAGQDLRLLAKSIKIVPIVGLVETSDVNEIMVIPIAAPSTESMHYIFNNSAQRVIRMSYDAYPDDTKRNRLAYLGDDSADTSAAGAW